MCYVQWKYFGLFHLPYLLYVFIFCSIWCYCWLAAWTILLYGFPDIILIFLLPPLQFILISTLMDSSFFYCPKDTGISWILFLTCPFPSLFCMLFSSTHGFYHLYSHETQSVFSGPPVHLLFLIGCCSFDIRKKNGDLLILYCNFLGP